MFKDSSDPSPDMMSGFFSEPLKGASGWVHNAHQHTQGCCLPASVGAKHTEHLATFYFKIQIIDGPDSTEMLCEALNGEYGFQNFLRLIYMNTFFLALVLFCGKIFYPFANI